MVSELSFFFRDEYFRMKLQWKSVSEEQEKRNSRLRDYRSLIGKFMFRSLPNCTHACTSLYEIEKSTLLKSLREEALKTNILLFSEVSKLGYILNIKTFSIRVLQSFTY